MMSSLKILGLALVAVLAMSAIAASAASAAEEFHGPAGTTILEGSQEGTGMFTTMGGTISCTTATYVGELVGPTATEVSVTPAYSGCTAFGFINTPIHVNGCKYVFTSSGTSRLHIVCPSEKAIEVTAPGCTVTFGTQTPTGPSHVTYQHIGLGTTTELTTDVNIQGIHYIEHNHGVIQSCSNPTATTTDGTLVTQTRTTGKQGGVHVGIGWS